VKLCPGELLGDKCHLHATRRLVKSTRAHPLVFGLKRNVGLDTLSLRGAVEDLNPNGRADHHKCTDPSLARSPAKLYSSDSMRFVAIAYRLNYR
jgi:hypothetical protein